MASLITCRRSPVCTKFWKVLGCYQLCQTTNLTFSLWGLVTKLCESEVSLERRGQGCDRHLSKALTHHNRTSTYQVLSRCKQNFFYLSFSQANSPFLECQNGCCGSNPCLNGGTCHETCDVDGKRFRCECGPANTGRYCESHGKKSFVHTDLSLTFF